MFLYLTIHGQIVWFMCLQETRPERSIVDTWQNYGIRMDDDDE